MMGHFDSSLRFFENSTGASLLSTSGFFTVTFMSGEDRLVHTR